MTRMETKTIKNIRKNASGCVCARHSESQRDWRRRAHKCYYHDNLYSRLHIFLLILFSIFLWVSSSLPHAISRADYLFFWRPAFLPFFNGFSLHHRFYYIVCDDCERRKLKNSLCSRVPDAPAHIHTPVNKPINANNSLKNYSTQYTGEYRWVSHQLD